VVLCVSHNILKSFSTEGVGGKGKRSFRCKLVVTKTSQSSTTLIYMLSTAVTGNFTPRRGVKICHDWWVHLSVCLSVSISQKHMAKLHRFLCMLTVAVAWSFTAVIRYVVDVTFSCNEPYVRRHVYSYKWLKLHCIEWIPIKFCSTINITSSYHRLRTGVKQWRFYVGARGHSPPSPNLAQTP